MEEDADVEMPTCKRLRVVSSDNGATAAQSEPMDEFDNLYQSPPKTNDESADRSLLPASTSTTLSPQNEQKAVSPPKLPNLPGLGISRNSPEPANSAVQMEMKQPSPDSSQQMQLNMDVAYEETGRPLISEGTEEQHSQDQSLAETKIGTSGIGEQPEALKGHGQTEQEQDIRGHEVTVTMENHGPAVVDPVAKNEDLASLEVPHEAAKGDTVKALGRISSLDSPSHSASVDTSVQDPLAFLEASLPPPPPSREADLEALNVEVTGNKTEAEKGSVVEAPTFEHLATDNKHNPDAEFELDSSPLNSDSESSDDSSSSSSSDDANDYEMLDPEEQARRLMAEDGGSDEEGGGAKGKASGPLRTQNEKPDEDVPKPEVIVTVDMKIEELGMVEGTVENLILIKAKISGEYQVLEQGSVLCLENRSVIGVIAETLGRVQQPYYSVRFTNAAAISDAGLVKDTKIYYVEQHSTTVFTQPLKAFKGSDASNLHDEEIGDDELEFSDDEAEAEHKRSVKLQRQQKLLGPYAQSDCFTRGPRGGRGGLIRGGRGGRGRTAHPRDGFAAAPALQEHAPNPAERGLNYDDVGHDMSVDTEDLYTPLARPTNLHELPQPPAISAREPRTQWGGDRGGHSRGRGGRDRGGGRGFGRGRGQGQGQVHGQGQGQGPWTDGIGRGGGGGAAQPSSFQHSPSSNGLPSWQQGNGPTPGPAPPLQNQYPAMAIPNQHQHHQYQHQYSQPPQSPQQQQQPYSPFPVQYPPPHNQWTPQHQTSQYPQTHPQQQQQHYQSQPQSQSQQYHTASSSSPSTYHHNLQNQHHLPHSSSSSSYTQHHHPPFSPGTTQQSHPPPPPPNIPPGAHINPAFFSSSQAQPHHQQPQQHHQQQGGWPPQAR